jgi:hypothetical protein
MTNIRQKDSLEYFFTITPDPIVIGSGVTESGYTSRTVNLNRKTYTESYTNYQINLSEGQTLLNTTPLIYSMVGNVATRTVAGIGSLKITGASCNQFIELNFGGRLDYYVDSIISYTAGSIGAAVDAQLIASLNAQKDSLYYNGASYAACAAQAGGIQRNPNCWAAGFDFSGVCVTYLYGMFNGGGALITRRHYVVSNHYESGGQLGTLLRFVGNDGSIHTRTVQKITNGAGGPYGNPVWDGIGDCCVFLLSADLPSSVISYPVVGDWFPLVIPKYESGTFRYDDIIYDAPFITTQQNRKITFTRLANILANYSSQSDLNKVINGHPFTVSLGQHAIFQSYIKSNNFTQFESNAYTGDSGSPVFMPLAGNQMALYSVMFFPDSGTRLNQSKLNAMILDVDGQAGISTGYTVTVAPSPI